MRFASMLVILMSISCVILSSFKEFQPYGWLFQSFIHLASLLFLIEYVLRIYSAPALNPELPASSQVYLLILRYCGFCGCNSFCDDLLLLGYGDSPHHHSSVCFHRLQTDTLLNGLSAYTQGDEECPLGTVDGIHRLSYHHLLFGHTGILRGERCPARSVQEHRRQHVVGCNHLWRKVPSPKCSRTSATACGGL